MNVRNTKIQDLELKIKLFHRKENNKTHKIEKWKGNKRYQMSKIC